MEVNIVRDLVRHAEDLMNDHAPREWNIPVRAIAIAIDRGYKSENQVRFHNFRHAVNVGQMMHLQVKDSGLQQADKFILVFAALCHDIGHFGFTNNDIDKANSPFKTDRRGRLKERYSAFQKSYLEFFHLQETLKIFDRHLDGNANFNTDRARTIIEQVILATDLGNKEAAAEFIKNETSNHAGFHDIPREALLYIKVIFSIFYIS